MVHISGFDELGHDDVAVAGGKGANLGELVRAGLPVPPGFVLTTSAYREFVRANDLGERILALSAVPSDAAPEQFEQASERIRALFAGGAVPESMAEELRAAYGELAGAGPGDKAGAGGEHTAVAVRSSATAEDLASASFAGQQDTYLNVRGADALIAAVRDCWASLWTARAMAYRRREGIETAVDPADVALAVVVQRMVEADSAGVMFTANPANGRRDQVVIGAAWGLGESVVGGSVTTDDLVVRACAVCSRYTADKKVMTVYAEHGTVELPVPEDRRREPVLDDAAAVELAAIGGRVAVHYGRPQDIEWVRADGGFAIVQARPITALPEPSAEAPTDWTGPYPGGMYFRASIVEQLPDPLTPLFADVIDGSVTRSLTALMNQVFGASALRDGDISLPTVNGYAYYFYRSSAYWRMARGLPGALVKLGRGHANMGVRGWREVSHPAYTRIVAAWTDRPLGKLSAGELLDGLGELLDAGTVYYTAVQSVIPLAASSEIAFRGFYDRLVRRADDPTSLTFLLGYDSEPIRAEKSLWDLAVWTREDPALAGAVSTVTVAAAGSDDPPDGVDPERWRAWRARYVEHLDRHGHVVYNLDFASPVPADDPAPVLDTLRFYLSGQGGDPHLRQRASAERRESAATAVRARLDPVRRAAFDRLLRRAQSTGPIREDALADIGLGWPVMRRLLAELGRRLVADGVLTEPADVFWLRNPELRAAAVDGDPPAGLADEIEQRKMTWRGRRKAVAPQLLPESGRMQRMFGWAMPAGDQQQTGDVITGVGASGGQVSAPARVLDGPADFGLLQPGDVLVARMTTPAWTSLFTKASGVVTDVGGPLSHSSIVAREYGIPAVLGTGVATQRLLSGQRVRVDGDAGTVTRLDN